MVSKRGMVLFSLVSVNDSKAVSLIPGKKDDQAREIEIQSTKCKWSDVKVNIKEDQVTVGVTCPQSKGDKKEPSGDHDEQPSDKSKDHDKPSGDHDKPSGDHKEASGKPEREMYYFHMPNDMSQDKGGHAPSKYSDAIPIVFSGNANFTDAWAKYKTLKTQPKRSEKHGNQMFITMGGGLLDTGAIQLKHLAVESSSDESWCSEKNLLTLVNNKFSGIAIDLEMVEMKENVNPTDGKWPIVRAFEKCLQNIKKLHPTMKIIVTTSHTRIILDYESDSYDSHYRDVRTKLLEWVLTDTNIDVVSPQLYSQDVELLPDVAESTGCVENVEGGVCGWKRWATRTNQAKFIPVFNYVPGKNDTGNLYEKVVTDSLHAQTIALNTTLVNYFESMKLEVEGLMLWENQK